MTSANSIFITGGTGLLGLTWAQTMKGRSEVTLGLHERRAVPPGTKGVAVELADAEALRAALEEARPTLVVHTAALTNVDVCEADPRLAREANVELAGNVAAQCARLGIAMVHVSTDHLFDGAADSYGEDDPVAPLNVYARTKADAEKAVLDRHPGALVMRTNFYCWGPPYRHSFSDWIVASLRGGEPISLFEDVSFTPILASVACETAHALVDRGASGIYHVSGDDAVTKHGFGMSIADVFGLDAGLIGRGRLADAKHLVLRPRGMNLCNAKARQLLGGPLGGLQQQLGMLARQENSILVQELAMT